MSLLRILTCFVYAKAHILADRWPMDSTLLAGNRSSVGIAMFWSKPQQPKDSWSSTCLPESFLTDDQPLGKATCSVSVRQKPPEASLRLSFG
jgi:hypothetical protein